MRVNTASHEKAGAIRDLHTAPHEKAGTTQDSQLADKAQQGVPPHEVPLPVAMLHKSIPFRNVCVTAWYVKMSNQQGAAAWCAWMSNASG